jgi:L-methionine (R)-S-oxide reductase
MSVKIAFDKNIPKEEIYKAIIPQIEALINDENNFIANLSNISSVLKYSLNNINWAGFYLFDKNSDELVLGPFQGKVACTRIKTGKGVCGTAAAERKTVVVEDVNKFEGHIFCDGDSKSEIVIPVIINTEVKGVLDIDSNKFSNFDSVDKKYLEELINKISKIF